MKILDGNIHSLFDHQTVLEDSNRGTLQIKNKAFSGIDKVVPIADSGAESLDITDIGRMEIKKAVLPDKVDTLCIDDEWLKQYYVTVYSYGGYHPSYEYSDCYHYIKVYQKNGAYYQGKIKISWQDVTSYYEEEKVCCAEKWWNATFSVHPSDADGKICLDAQNWPDLGDFTLTKWPEVGCSSKIPGKKVEFRLHTDWAGCPYRNQHFTIISVRDSYQFLK